MTAEKIKKSISDLYGDVKADYEAIFDEATDAMANGGDVMLIRQFHTLAGQKIALETLMDIIKYEEGNDGEDQ